MPQFCAVLNCGSNSLRDKVSFFRFPSTTDSYKINLVKKERREEWIKALKRSDLTESKLKNQRVCEKHFITGKPASLEERNHPDWIPTQNLGHTSKPQVSLEPEPPVETEQPENLHSFQISSLFLLEHNYCLLPPSLTPLMSSNLVPLEVEATEELLSAPAVQEMEKPPIVTADAPPSPPASSSGDSNSETPEPQPVLKEEPVTEVEPEVKEEMVELPTEEPLPEPKEEFAEEIETAQSTPAQQEVEDSVTRCICGFQHDDGFMICCDKCMVWQHVDCMGIERGDIPEEYLCEECEPRKVDRARAVSLQRSKKKLFDEMLKTSAADTPPSSSDQSNSDGENAGGKANRRRKDSRKDHAAKKKKISKPAIILKKKRVPKREAKTPKRDDFEDSEDYDGGDLRSWIDAYEEATTNHYSPELRARVAVLKAHGIRSEEALIGAHSARPKSKVTSAFGQTILVATCNISAGQPVVEIRGKYMLQKSGSASPPSVKSREQYVFHHHISGPGLLETDVQVDASTYGNCARFTRSSCSPNVQIKHCVEKGTLHLYLVSTAPIDTKTELTLPHRPGATCSLGDKCSLLSSGKRRNRKQVLVERSVPRDSALANNNNNNNKGSPAKKRSISSERPVSSKVLKSTSGNVPTFETSSDSPNKTFRGKVTLRSAMLTANTRRSESKTRSHSINKN